MLKEAADDLEWPAAAAGISTAAPAGAGAGGGAGAAGGSSGCWARLALTRDPPTLALSSSAGGAAGGGGLPGGGERSVEVCVPVDDLAAFSCAGAEVAHAYPLRALRAALGHVPTAAAAALAMAGAGEGGGGGGGGGFGGSHGGPPPAAAVEYTKVRVDARGLLSVAHMLRVAGGGGAGGGGGGRGAGGGGGGLGGGGGGAMGPKQMAEGRAGGALVQYVVQPLADEAAYGEDQDDGI
jgi:hypothetical protein